jgi:hypothetical protein
MTLALSEDTRLFAGLSSQGRARLRASSLSHVIEKPSPLWQWKANFTLQYPASLNGSEDILYQELTLLCSGEDRMNYLFQLRIPVTHVHF